MNKYDHAHFPDDYDPGAYFPSGRINRPRRKEEKDSWICRFCGSTNLSHITSCERCNAPKGPTPRERSIWSDGDPIHEVEIHETYQQLAYARQDISELREYIESSRQQPAYHFPVFVAIFTTLGVALFFSLIWMIVYYG